MHMSQRTSEGRSTPRRSRGIERARTRTLPDPGLITGPPGLIAGPPGLIRLI